MPVFSSREDIEISVDDFYYEMSRAEREEMLEACFEYKYGDTSLLDLIDERGYDEVMEEIENLQVEGGRSIPQQEWIDTCNKLMRAYYNISKEDQIIIETIASKF
jgi:hypothetical protein